MGRLYVIMGKSAVGKDSLYCSLIDRNPALKTVVPYTTRPIRTGEVEGKEYHFVTESELEKMRQQGRIVECRRYDTVHGPWYYFTVDDGQLDFSGDGQYVIISTLEGFEKLRAFYGKEHVVPVYIEVEEFVRLERALEQHPQLAIPMMRYLANTVGQLSRQVNDLSFQGTEARLAVQLLREADEAGQVRVTQEELGFRVGVTRITVARVLRRWADRGWVETGYGAVWVRDPEALRELTLNA